MLHILQRLARGDATVVDHCRRAAARWETILASRDAASVLTLAECLTAEQTWFEDHCGGRIFAWEVMVWMAYARLYDHRIGLEQEDELAVRISDAFAASRCSIEVKWLAEAAGRRFAIAELDAHPAPAPSLRESAGADG